MGNVLKTYEEQDVHRVFELGAPMGRSQAEVVCPAIRQSDHTELAAKAFCKARLDGHQQSRVMDEVSIMLSLQECQSPHVLRVYEVFQTDENLYIFMELCKGPDLLGHLLACKDFSERKAALITRTLAHTIEALHERGITHRNISLDSIQLLREDAHPEHVRILKYGCAKHRHSNAAEYMTEIVGRVDYAAPEMLENEYGQEVDIWSLGVALFIMLGGYPPFAAQSAEEMLEVLQEEELTFPPLYWGHISQDAKSLLEGMMAVEPAQRLDAREVLQHPWIQKAVHLPNQPFGDSYTDRIAILHGQRSLKRAVAVVGTISTFSLLGKNTSSMYSGLTGSRRASTRDRD